MVAYSRVSSVASTDDADTRIRKTMSHASRSSSSSGRRYSRYDDDNDTVRPDDSSSRAGSNASRSRVSSVYSSRSRSCAVSRRPEPMPIIMDDSDSDEWNSGDERWVLDEWERARPTAPSGVRYDQRPGQGMAYASVGRRRSVGPPPQRYTEMAARSEVSRRSSRAPSHHDSDSEGEYRSRVSASSRRSGASRSSGSVDGESINERLRRLNLGSDSGAGAEATLRIPDSYRPPSSRSSYAGSSASRSSRCSRGSGY